MLRVRLVLFACLACFAWGCAETQHPGDESASSDDVPRHTKHRSKKKKKKVAHKSDDDEDAPKKKKKSSDDDDDDAPKKKVAAKKHSDDDEDDAPKKKPPAKKVVAKHSDDDEDDAPKKKPAPKVVAKHSDDDEDDEPKKKPPAKKIVAKKSSDDDEDEAPKKPRNPHSELVDDKPKKVAAKHAIDDEPKISDDDEDEKPKAKPVAKAKPKAKSEDDDLPRSVLKARAKAKAEEDEDEKPKPVAVKAKHTSDDEEDEKPKPKPVAVKAKAKSDDEEDKPKKAVAKAKPKSDDEEDKPKKTVAKAKSDDEEDKPKHVEEKHEEPPPEEPPKKQRSIEEDIAVDDPLATLPPKRAVASSEEEAGGEEEETTVTGQAATAPTKHGEILQDRSLTTPAGQLDLHAGLPINVLTTTDAMGVSSSATSEGLALGVAYGVNGKAELGFDYTLGLSPGSIKGPATAHAAYSFAKGKLDFAAAAALGIDFFDTVDPVAMTTASNTAASLQLGAWVRYHATPTVSIFSGLPGLPNASASLSKLAFALPVLSYQIQIGLSDKGSSALTLPIGLGYQASPKLYTFASLNLANIRIANTSNAFLFKDYIPIAIGGFYTFDTFSLGASFADDLKQGFGYLRFELVARYLLH